MKILIDIQGLQTEGSRLRGIGRYSYQLIFNLIKNYPDHEYILFANPYLKDVRADFKSLISNQELNLYYFHWYSPGPFKNESSLEASKDWFAKQLRSYAIASLSVDVVLLTSFFEGFFDNALVGLSNEYNLPPITTILYDLIPLVQAPIYLDNNPLYKVFYSEKIQKLQSLDGYLAISQSTLKEVNDHTNISNNKIYNISSACDEFLFNKVQEKFYLDKLKEEPLEKYIFYSGAGDARKNIKSLIFAYSKLSFPIQSEYKLVLAGKLLSAEKLLLEECIAKNNLKKEMIIILGYVSDSELVSLYSHCSLFVFPSLHEGFGLPVLEAMSCGAPVIGSNLTSIPEIIGDRKALFNPNDIEELTKLIEKALTDKLFKEHLIQNSLSAVKKFSWTETSKRAISALIKISSTKLINATADNINENLIARETLFNRIKSVIKTTNKGSKNNILIQQVSSSLELMDAQILDFKRRIKKLIPGRSWRIEGPFDSNYSLALLNKNFIRSMYKINQDITITSTDGDSDYSPSKQFLNINKDIDQIYRKSLNEKSVPSIVSRNLYPPRVFDMNGMVKILHSYGWEESQFPSSWIDEFNKNLDGISVMSEYVKKTLIDNGLSIPITVSSLGLDHINNKVEDIGIDFDFSVNNFCFLHISSCFPRKGANVLIKSYCASFTEDDDVTLIIKTIPNIHNDVKDQLKEIRSKTKNLPNICLIEEDYTDDQILALYQISDALVAPSYGEGFGLPIGEAMKVGLPVITTGFGGQLDFCNDHNSWLIDFQYCYSNTHFGLTSSSWVEPSKDHLSSIMREIYSSNKDDINQKVLEAKKTIDTYKWDNVAKSNLNFVNKIVATSDFDIPRIGILTTWNSRCGIASYSKNILKYILDFKLIFAPFNEEVESLDDDSVFRCWDMNPSEVQNYNELLISITSNSISTLLIQFNFGFFNYPLFKKLLNQLYIRNVKVIIILHSTISPSTELNFKNLFPEIQICDRLLVHTVSDLNRLKNVGLDKKATLFPHGIIDYFVQSKNLNRRFKRRFKSIKLATFGFALPNKGFIQLIEAVDMLKDIYPNISLTMLTAKYNFEYEYVIEDLNEKIKVLGLDKIIDIQTDYMTEKNSLNILSKMDLIVLPYQSTNESSSASVRHSLASGTPVAITPQQIFEDVKDVTYHLPGCSSELIKEGIKQFFDSGYLSFLSKDNLDFKAKWISQHRFSRIGKRLQGLIRGIESEKKYDQ